MWFDQYEKIILIAALVSGVSAASFAIGYLIANRNATSPIVIQKGCNDKNLPGIERLQKN